MVLLNWNGQKFLAQFLPSVTANSIGHLIYVVDNHSTDNSVAYLQENYPQIKLIQHHQNLGFCEGYNQALRQIRADYYVLLNSDVEVTAGWLDPLITLMESDATIAACQPKLKSYQQRDYLEYAGAGGGLLDRFGYPFCRGRLFNSLEKDEGQYNDILLVFWATGACMFVRAATYHQMKGLEPAFFAHMEEIDLCWRFQNKGYKVMYCGQSEVYHVGGGTLPASNPRKTFLNFRNGLALLYKNFPARGFYSTLFTRLVLDWIAALKFLLSGHPADSWAVLKAHRAVWQNRSYWRQKRAEQFGLDLPNLSGWFNGSIVWEYFIRRKKSYRELKFKRFTSFRN
ncbi:dTDP-Rha--alpha-D-GlcNAc-pyrophosphate polyprenol alpha-3-L-rhamnosyltransferase [Adhaeribacter arboris]|uniref:dTDP-Rha--alpha-D-GlcNAc-pyrophosphate polyprenol alpha-3-L-rhamnosyltransferase n=1 Tax=Adhaeribacter arboris TaxID=2072846 RepID=A0A2T2YNT2_9BACT|nr:dTDP-Rha--alpha-D-GlcNAc-pyrophosphate polyprenol alpha-3-L-rhamnosyltransferase [Adhaeribacter arboris]